MTAPTAFDRIKSTATAIGAAIIIIGATNAALITAAWSIIVSNNPRKPKPEDGE